LPRRPAVASLRGCQNWVAPGPHSPAGRFNLNRNPTHPPPAGLGCRRWDWQYLFCGLPFAQASLGACSGHSSLFSSLVLLVDGLLLSTVGYCLSSATILCQLAHHCASSVYLKRIGRCPAAEPYRAQALTRHSCLTTRCARVLCAHECACANACFCVPECTGLQGGILLLDQVGVALQCRREECFVLT
jgi:hypothetical protein